MSIKPQEDRVQRASKLVNTWRIGVSGIPRESIEAPHFVPIPCSGQLFHLAISKLYPFILNQ